MADLWCNEDYDNYLHMLSSFQSGLMPPLFATSNICACLQRLNKRIISRLITYLSRNRLLYRYVHNLILFLIKLYCITFDNFVMKIVMTVYKQSKQFLLPLYQVSNRKKHVSKTCILFVSHTNMYFTTLSRSFAIIKNSFGNCYYL